MHNLHNNSIICIICIIYITCIICIVCIICIIIWLILKTFLWRSRKRKNVSEKTPSATKKPKALRNLEDDEEVEEDDSSFASGEVRRNSRGLSLTPTGRPSIKLNEVNRKFTPKYHNREYTKTLLGFGRCNCFAGYNPAWTSSAC